MLATEFLHGQGLGNQLFAYVTTRVLARRLGYDFGIKGLQNAGDSRVNKKGFYFMNLDYGKKVPDDLEIYFEQGEYKLHEMQQPLLNLMIQHHPKATAN